MGMARTRRVSTFVVAFNDSRIVDGPGFTSIYRWIYSWWPNSNFFSDPGEEDLSDLVLTTRLFCRIRSRELGDLVLGIYHQV